MLLLLVLGEGGMVLVLGGRHGRQAKVLSTLGERGTKSGKSAVEEEGDEGVISPESQR